MNIKILFFFLLCILAGNVFSQTGKTDGIINGTVTFKESGAAARNATVTIAELKRTVLTDENGKYEIDHVPAGKYDVIVQLERVSNLVKTVDVSSGASTIDFELPINAINEQVTVTATGSLEAINNSFQSVTTVGALQLAEKNSLSIGEALGNEPGVANRSFGPGSGRPVIRGFDGDRVLVLQDGLRVGGIASGSGDEVEPIDILSLDRVEIVNGPATLLYGSNAIGGVVNGVSANTIYQNGVSGYLTGFGGTNNSQVGANGGLKLGFRNFLFFGNGGMQKADDYRSPNGTVLNSFARTGNVSGGAGWFPRNGWLIFTYGYDRRRHGIPVEPDEIDLESLNERRHAYEVKAGFRDLGNLIESGDFAVSYNNYLAREFEFETDENVTELEGTATNKNFNYRAFFNHRRRGKLSGTFGFSGFTRDFESIGAEAPAPRTKQNSFAAFALERFDFERIGFQFGGRVEQNGYNPAGGLRNRNFLGFSGSAGVRVPLWTGGSFVANYQHSFRAPALEELYNNGRHPGIGVFDIGNPNLNPEQGDGVDFSLRHNSERFRLAVGGFYYNLRNYVYTAFTGMTDPGSNLPIIEYSQGNSRYLGAEATLDAKLVETLWFSGKLDYVQATLIDFSRSLPRIPPLRSTLRLDWRYKSFNLRPEIVLAARQDRIFDNETPTAGYAVFNLNGSYTFFKGRSLHTLIVSGYNLNNKLYRNHLSFIKNIAPEIGRGVKFTYALRF
ncbi:MAG: TonB-dependent receptor [Pyrinomonadaceae bacterium]